MDGLFRVMAVWVGSITYSSLMSSFKLLAEYYNCSSTLLGNCRQICDDGYTRRVIRSIRPMRANLMDNFIDSSLLLTMTAMILDNAITLLLL